MSDSERPASNSITLRFGDPKVWAFIAAMVGGQFVAGKLSISGVENRQERAVDKQQSIDDKLETIKASQHEFQGEMRYRMDAIEKASIANRSEVQGQLRDLQQAIETRTKGGR